METTADYELSLARNLRGDPLPNKTKASIEAYLRHGRREDWPAIANTIVWNDPPLPLWRAVEIIAPGGSGRDLTVHPDGTKSLRWKHTPTPEIVRAALCYATH